MARDGYGFDANPYTDINRRLAMRWSQGHATMHALQCRFEKRRHAALLRMVSSNPHLETTGTTCASRPRPQLRIVR